MQTISEHLIAGVGETRVGTKKGEKGKKVLDFQGIMLEFLD
jgi:hypothetical protein